MTAQKDTPSGADVPSTPKHFECPLASGFETFGLGRHTPTRKDVLLIPKSQPQGRIIFIAHSITNASVS